MPLKRKKTTKKTKFHRMFMLSDLQNDDHADDVKAVVDSLPTGIHLQCYETRKKFMADLCHGDTLEALNRFMVNRFLEMYREYMKGKRFAQWAIPVNKDTQLRSR